MPYFILNKKGEAARFDMCGCFVAWEKDRAEANGFPSLESAHYINNFNGKVGKVTECAQPVLVRRLPLPARFDEAANFERELLLEATNDDRFRAVVLWKEKGDGPWTVGTVAEADTLSELSDWFDETFAGERVGVADLEGFRVVFPDEETAWDAALVAMREREKKAEKPMPQKPASMKPPIEPEHLADHLAKLRRLTESEWDCFSGCTRGARAFDFEDWFFILDGRWTAYGPDGNAGFFVEDGGGSHYWEEM